MTGVPAGGGICTGGIGWITRDCKGVTDLTHLRLAACQFLAGADKTANLAEIESLVARAAAEGARLAVFPEFAAHYAEQFGLDAVAGAEPLHGAFVSALSELASRFGVTLIAGMLEEIAGEQHAYNTLVVIDPARGLVASYRKQHLYDAFGFKESDYLRPGPVDEPVIVDIEGVKIGLLTCYDLRFPEAARVHVDAGAEVLVYAAAWVPGPRKEDHWRTLARARAIENTVFVAAISQTPPRAIGGSLVIDPNGVVLTELGEAPGVSVVTITPERIAEVRGFNPSLANRRYGITARV